MAKGKECQRVIENTEGVMTKIDLSYRAWIDGLSKLDGNQSSLETNVISHLESCRVICESSTLKWSGSQTLGRKGGRICHCPTLQSNSCRCPAGVCSRFFELH